MTRISAIVLIAAATIAFAPAPSFAQRAGSPRGTNSAGTAQSSGGARHRDHNASNGGLGSGHAKEPATPSADAVIKQENALLDRKLKGICRGC
jgi:hypothetical protein